MEYNTLALQHCGLPDPATHCHACNAPQPAEGWQRDRLDVSLQTAWEQAAPEHRYCGLCGYPACDDDTLDQLRAAPHDQQAQRLYGSNLVNPTPEVVAFMAGWDVVSKGAADQGLVPFDLWVNRAHTRMLVAQSILTAEQGQAILAGLAEIERQYHHGHFIVRPALEDVHTSIEKYLTDILGIEAGLAMHTARSRNDQIVTDMRLWMRARVLNLAPLCLGLMQALTTVAQVHLDSVMAGYTHHQHATISTFGHHLAAYAEAIRRVVQRLNFWYETFNYSPLGCVTGFSTSLPIDRYLTAELLGCYGPEPNAIDPIASRWEPEADLAQSLAILLNHLSSMAQTFILLSTQEFGVLKLHPRFCSGSSIMPQKVNPDTLEVIKAKATEVTSRLSALLSLGRASLSGYNREQQWTKYLIMEACLESFPAVAIMTRIVAHSCRPLQTNPWLQRPVGIDVVRLRHMACTGFAGATELLEQLVAHTGIEFRRLKRVVEHAVALSLQQGEVDVVTHEALERALRAEGLAVTVDADTVRRLQDPTTILAAKQVVGGPGPQALQAELAQLDTFIATQRQAWEKRADHLRVQYAVCQG
jgi:argininosuccinate lyase